MNNRERPKLANATARGTIWLYLANFFSKLILFLSTVILARLLSPDDFGVVGFAVTALGFLELSKGLGLGFAQIYHQDKSDIVVTSFWLNMGISLLMCSAVWIGAPVIGQFFNDPRAVWVSRVLALNFPLSAMYGAHESLLFQELGFNRKFIPDIAQALCRGVISITLALMGFGPWSLVIGQLGGTVTAGFIFWRLVSWRPSLKFSIVAAYDLMRFSLPMLGATVVSLFVLNTDYLFVGRFLGAESLGVYTLGFRIPELVIQTFCNIVATVIFPVFVKIRADTESLGRGFLKLTQYISLFTVPLGLGLALLADSFIIVVFTEKWIVAAPIMRAISIYMLLNSLGYSAGDIYKAQGKPGILTRLAFIRLFLLIPGLYWAVTVPANLVAVGWVQIGVALIGSLIYLVVALRILDLPPTSFVKSLRPAFLGGAFLTLAVWTFLSYFSSGNAWFKLIGGSITGGVAYLCALWLLQRDVVKDGLMLLRTINSGEKSTSF